MIVAYQNEIPWWEKYQDPMWYDYLLEPHSTKSAFWVTGKVKKNVTYKLFKGSKGSKNQKLAGKVIFL